MGGTNLRVLETILQGGGQIKVGREVKSVIPQSAQTGTAEALFDFIAASMAGAGMPPGAVVGFTFSFPVAQTAVDAGRLIEWTKGFTTSGVVGQDALELLELACHRRGLSVQLVALVNDTVGTLLACAYTDPAARMGVILGTGTNAAYRESDAAWPVRPVCGGFVSLLPSPITPPHLPSHIHLIAVERVSNIPKWQLPVKEGSTMVINMEWGGFGSSNSSHLPFHASDHAMDALTPNESRQVHRHACAGWGGCHGGVGLGRLVYLCLSTALVAPFSY